MNTNKDMEIIAPDGYEAYEQDGKILFRKEVIFCIDVLLCKIGLLVSRRRMKYENGYPVAPCVLLNSTRDNEKILDKVEAIMKLIGVAKYLNGDWKPDWEREGELIYTLNIYKNHIGIDIVKGSNSSVAYFKTAELAEKAIKILGTSTIIKALSTDY